MKYGIFYGSWAKNWSGEYIPYVHRAKECGFDILSISSGYLLDKSSCELYDLKSAATVCVIELHAGFGPSAKSNLTSEDEQIAKDAFKKYNKIFKVLEYLNIPCLGGNFYSCSPAELLHPLDKNGDWDRLASRIFQLSDMANDHGISLMMEVVCRYEGYLINTAKEGVRFINQVNKDNIMLMLDTFHMNIEEDSFADAILTAGNRLGYLHTGECNRMAPGLGRIPWNEIRYALKKINFVGSVTMEPFMINGGTIGEDLGVYRDLTHGASDRELDEMFMRSLQFTKYVLDY